MTSKHYRFIHIEWDEESHMNEELNLRLHKDEIVVSMVGDDNGVVLLISTTKERK